MMASPLSLHSAILRPSQRSLAYHIRRRQSPLANQCSRPLSSFSLADTVVFTGEVLTSIHNAGLPWLWTFPLAAVGVNFALRLPLAYYTRKASNKRADLQPLVTGWRTRHYAKMQRDTGGQPSGKQRIDTAMALARDRRRVYKAFGVQPWKTYVTIPLGMVPFVIMTLGIRDLGLASRALGEASLDVPPTPGATAQMFTQDMMQLADPSMHHAGALWFPDLAAADPYMALPLACSALVLYNALRPYTLEQLRYLLSSKGEAEALRPGAISAYESLPQRMFVRMALFVPILPLLSANMPAAMILYWLTNFGLSNVNDVILKRIAPRPKQAAPGASKKRIHCKPYIRE